MRSRHPATAAAALAAILCVGGPLAAGGEAPAVVNGSFDAGGDTPAGWEKTPDVEMRRDTEVFRSAPASLCVVASGKNGNANQKVAGLAARAVVIRGYARKEKALANAQVFALKFDKGWKSLGWDTLLVVPATGEWTAFEAAREFPPQTGVVLLGIYAGGTGRAWLDDVTIEATTPAGLRAKSLAERLKAFELHDLRRFEGPAPELLHLGAVAPDILCLHIRELFKRPGSFGPYEPEPGDEVAREKGPHRVLKRKGGAVGQIGGPEGALHLRTYDRRTGKPLQLRYAMDPASYTLTAAGGAAGGAVEVEHVYRKTKPVDHTKDGYCREHMIFLDLASPLQAGAAYTLAFGRVNLREPSASFTFDVTRLRSEAVHASQVGYRADDPVKLGFLSMWMGTGGACAAYSAGMRFRLVDAATGEAAYEGRTRLRARRTKVAHGLHAKGRNFELADTYVCDFSEFRAPGEYVLAVDGVGASYPFGIGEDAWRTAFVASMRGFYHQRSGQAWEEPYAAWPRPRDLHPADGAHNTVYELGISELDFATNLGDGKLEKLLEFRTERTLPDAWGGYHDAGDYDRRQGHMVASRRMMELVDLFPDYFRRLALSVPENANRLPDVLDEALWCPALYRRMQRGDGGVRGGIETNGHPNHGEASHLDTLTKMAFAPDVRASWTYAATAAQAARLLRQYGDAATAAAWETSALRAMEWAEREYAASRAKFDGLKGWWHIRNMRNLAAAHVFRLTSGRPGEAERWHTVFRETCGYKDEEKPTTFKWGSHVQAEAAMVYARLEDGLGDAALKAKSREAIANHADLQIAYAERQAYMFTADDIGAPMILSSHAAPRGLDVCRAHYLTGDARYLEWAVRSSQFSVGNNPMNVVMTTGLGHRPARHPLYLDMKYMARDAPPPGITVYGIHDPVFFKTSWAYRWILDHRQNCVPGYREWPLSEFFFDVYAWPLVNEFTVQQSMAPAVYVWGYLAARGR